MSDDVRRMIFIQSSVSSGLWMDRENGTHALMPWDTWVEKCAQYDAVCDSEERLRAELAEKDSQLFCFEAELETAKKRIKELSIQLAMTGDEIDDQIEVLP